MSSTRMRTDSSVQRPSTRRPIETDRLSRAKPSTRSVPATTKQIPVATTKSKKTAHTVALWNPAGSDGFPLLEELAKLIRKRGESLIVVEFPCLGIPRLAYHLGLLDIPEDQTIDQLLVDRERGIGRSIHDYIQTFELFDGLVIYPKSKPDAPVTVKLKEESIYNETPSYIKSQLSGYDHIIFLLQGQMTHAHTFFSLRESDQAILAIDHPVELIYTYAAFKLLRQSYNVNPVLFDMGRNDLRNFKEEKIHNRVDTITSTWGSVSK